MGSGDTERSGSIAAETDSGAAGTRTLDLSRIGTVYIACGYSDLRKGINGLAAQIHQQFKLDPRDQAVFLFCGKRSDRFKALFWDGDGYHN